jgi:trans-AT polyketide synthase/acyltransferase/oxidoreductase domain-containing protein
MLIDPASLGSAEFRAAHGVRHAYVAGAMYKGVASVEMVTAMGRAGLLAFFGAGGVPVRGVESAIERIQADLAPGQPYGMNLLCYRDRPDLEEQIVDVYLRRGIRRVEAAAFTQMTSSLVRYRLAGISIDSGGAVHAPNHVLAKVSRPEVATAFMSPAPAPIVRRLVESGHLSATEAELAAHVPISDDVCVESDSAGHTDQGVALVLLPAMLLLRDELMRRYGYAGRIRVGAAGGIGTPHAAAAAFLMGADFILTGSINQCTVEAGTSNSVKDLLQDINVQDTAYAPAGDMFESGARVQVLKKGVFFPMRASKLYELYCRHESLEDIEPGTRAQIEKWFGRSLDDVWSETKEFCRTNEPRALADAERSPKRRMALVFKWYFAYSSRLAFEGRDERRVDYQVHCGPALGAFNQWVKGTPLESWRQRHVAAIADALMAATAVLLATRISGWLDEPVGASSRHAGAIARV